MKAVSPKVPARKPTRRSRDDDDDEPRGIRDRINRLANTKWGRRLVIPLGVLSVAFLLYDQLSGPSMSDAVARGKAAGYPVSHKLAADEFFSQATKGGKDAAKFQDVYIELSGKVRKVVSEPKRFAILLETPSPTQAVECQFGSADEVSGVRAGDQVVIQGEGQALGKGGEKENIRLGGCKLRR